METHDEHALLNTFNLEFLLEGIAKVNEGDQYNIRQRSNKGYQRI
jgi:hypothetical protein